jgi:hypothetical protein
MGIFGTFTTPNKDEESIPVDLSDKIFFDASSAQGPPA